MLLDGVSTTVRHSNPSLSTMVQSARCRGLRASDSKLTTDNSVTTGNIIQNTAVARCQLCRPPTHNRYRKIKDKKETDDILSQDPIQGKLCRSGLRMSMQTASFWPPSAAPRRDLPSCYVNAAKVFSEPHPGGTPDYAINVWPCRASLDLSECEGLDAAGILEVRTHADDTGVVERVGIAFLELHACRPATPRLCLKHAEEVCDPCVQRRRSGGGAGRSVVRRGQHDNGGDILRAGKGARLSPSSPSHAAMARRYRP